MSWNDGEVTVIPHQTKKPSYAGDYWKPSWKANYKGEDFRIEKDKSEGYVVRWKWKGRHPTHDNAQIVSQLIDLPKLKTMPQVKKLIRTFVDGMNNGKLVDVETGKTLSFNTFLPCTACHIFSNELNLYHRQNMFTHKYLWDRNEWNKKPYQCKWHTKLDVLEAMKKDGNTKSKDFDKMDIFAYKRKNERKMNRRNKIDVDALVPDSELIQMSNPYLEMARRRRGLEAEGEEEGYWSPKELVLKDYAIRTHEGKTVWIDALWKFGEDEFSTFTSRSGNVAGTQNLEKFKELKQKHGEEKLHDTSYQINRIARPFASKIAMCEMIHNMMRTSYFSLDEGQMKERQGLIKALTDYEFMSYRSNIYEDEEILFAMKIGGEKNWLKYKYDNKTGIGRWSQSKQINRHKKRDYDSGEFVWGIRQGMDDNTFTKYGQGLDISYEGGWRGYYREMKTIKVLNVKNDKFSKFLWTTNPEFFYNILIKLEPSMKDDFEWVNTKKNVRLQMARRRRGLEAEGIATNPLLWTGATVIVLLSYFKSN